ncbi:unnamed protein product [Pedinophyceae sp. YPF-701]|nr:unnamed protein product [Pedinophyceae sp. YPF-701]
MADRLASIFGTEKDRVNCPFYLKIGACRHGDRCSRMHNVPSISQSILIRNLYQNPVLTQPAGPDGLPLPIDTNEKLEDFEDFYEDVFEELAKYGEVEEMNVCDNLGDHLVGNVYVKFGAEEEAAACYQALQGRYYMGRLLTVEYSPVTDFRQATCRQYEESSCRFGGYCNYLHLLPVDRTVRALTFGAQAERLKREGRVRPRRAAAGFRDRGPMGRGRSPPRGGGFGGGFGGPGAGAERVGGAQGDVCAVEPGAGPGGGGAPPGPPGRRPGRREGGTAARRRRPPPPGGFPGAPPGPPPPAAAPSAYPPAPPPQGMYQPPPPA